MLRMNELLKCKKLPEKDPSEVRKTCLVQSADYVLFSSTAFELQWF